MNSLGYHFELQYVALLTRCFRYSESDVGVGGGEDEAAGRLRRGWHAKNAGEFPYNWYILCNLYQYKPQYYIY